MNNHRAHLEELKKLVDITDVHNEKECGDCLKKFPEILLPNNLTIYYYDSEITCSSGRVDLQIIADEIDVSGEEIRKIYLWELKAPQLYLFEIENNSRAKPTKQYYEAENQLLHYYNSVTKDNSLLERYRIPFRENVKFGGIVIGKEETFCRPYPEKPELMSTLASDALRLRKSTFYKDGIDVLTWDTVIKIAETTTMTHKKISVDVADNMKIDTTASEDVSASALYVDESVYNDIKQ